MAPKRSVPPANTEYAAIEKAALIHLKKVDPLLHSLALPHRGAISSRVVPKKTSQALFEALASSVVSQQLSTKAAASIYARVQEKLGGKVTPETIAKAKTATLRSAGLSAAKVRTLKELSQAILSKEIKLLSLKKAPPEEALEKLTRIWGIGPWTAEMFLIFAAGSPDIFSPGDLILAKKLEEIKGHSRGSKNKKELASLAEMWSPHRSFVSLLLWKLNSVDKQK